MASVTRRHCSSCGTCLARDNRDVLCSPCRKSRNSSADAPPAVPYDFWQFDTLQEAFRQRHFGKVFKAYRTHPFHGPVPLSQQLVAGWCFMTQARLSRIESGPPVTDLNRLAAWARVLGIPQEFLWFELPDSSDSSNRIRTAKASQALAPIQIPEYAWRAPDIEQALRDRNLSAIFHFARKYGISQQRIAANIGFAQGRISEIMTGKRQITSFAMVERVANAFEMPDRARMIFGLAPRVSFDEPSDTSSDAPGFRNDTAGTASARAGTVEGYTDFVGDWDDMERRRLLQLAALLGTGTFVMSEQHMHRLADMVMTREPCSFEEWEVVCADHLYAIRTRSPLKAREEILVDLLTLQRQLTEPGDEDVRELHRVHAALATLHANILTRLGEHGAALRWWRTARKSADICGDPELCLLVRGAEAGFGLYGQRAPETILLLTQNARRIKSGESSVGLVHITIAEAKALSLLGRHSEANQKVLALEEFTPGASTANPIPNYWTSDQVHFAQSWVYAGAGDESKADQARSHVLTQARDYQYLANVRLHAALCAVVNGGVDLGTGQAAELLETIPISHRSQMITETGNFILQAVPLEERNRDSVKEFREVLASTAPDAQSLNSGS
jgi:transcriptional regulator with XRE-family HTH domain